MVSGSGSVSDAWSITSPEKQTTILFGRAGDDETYYADAILRQTSGLFFRMSGAVVVVVTVVAAARRSA